jgi:hypothetical protein
MIGVQSKRPLLVATGLLGEKLGSVKECILQELRPLCFIWFYRAAQGAAKHDDGQAKAEADPCGMTNKGTKQKWQAKARARTNADPLRG